MKQQSPLLRIWELGEKEHGRLIGAIVLAAVGVIGGMVPYFAAAKMVALLMSGERDLSVYLIWGGAAPVRVSAISTAGGLTRSAIPSSTRWPSTPA